MASQFSDGSLPFAVAKTPEVDLAYHDNLGSGAARGGCGRRATSPWLATFGLLGHRRHGADDSGDARCFIYRWDPQSAR